jgi:hypothetical protein
MAPTDIDNLKPGPETDALVAEALGWILQTERTTTRTYIDWPSLGRGPNDLEHGYRPVPPYSTDWNAAMEAAEQTWEAARKDARPKRNTRGVQQSERGWTAWFGGYRHAEARAPSGPLAICEAILKAKQ